MNKYQKQLFDMISEKPIAYNPKLAKLLKSLTAGVLLSQLLYWWGKTKDQEWFYKTVLELEEETALSKEEQLGAIKKLKDLGLIETSLQGIPAKRNFKLNFEKIHQLVVGFSDNSVEEIPPTITENTTEIMSYRHSESVKTTLKEKLTTYLEEFNKLWDSKYQVTDKRRDKLQSRLKNYTFEQILQALGNLSQSKFHKGKNDRGWSATPDFLINTDEKVDEWLNWKPKVTDSFSEGYTVHRST